MAGVVHGSRLFGFIFRREVVGSRSSVELSMPAIPTSDLPGHAPLHARVAAALDRCQESRDVEFKESASWSDLRLKIVKTAMAMANLRDGGVIIIGASERDDTWSLDGITTDDLSTYDPDNIIAAVNKHASPDVELSVVRVTHTNGNVFLAIEIEQFAATPIVCKKTYDGAMRVGDIYHRPTGQPRTSRVTDARELNDLLDLAAEKRAMRIIRTAKRVGLEAKDTDAESYAAEQESMKKQRRVTALERGPKWKIIIRPKEYVRERVASIQELWAIVENVRIRRMGSDYPQLFRPDEYRLQGANWVGSWDDYEHEPQEWRLFQSSQFVQELGIRGSHGGQKAKHEVWARDHLSWRKDVRWDEVTGYVGTVTTVRTLTAAVEFATRLCRSEVISGTCEIVLRMSGIRGTMLTTDPRRVWHDVCIASEDVLEQTWSYAADELIADPITPPVEMSRWFFERFGWLSLADEVLRKDVEAFRTGRI